MKNKYLITAAAIFSVLVSQAGAQIINPEEQDRLGGERRLFQAICSKVVSAKQVGNQALALRLFEMGGDESKYYGSIIINEAATKESCQKHAAKLCALTHYRAPIIQVVGGVPLLSVEPLIGAINYDEFKILFQGAAYEDCGGPGNLGFAIPK